MDHNWLSATSFEDSMNLVATINELSTHTKLKIAGLDDENSVDIGNSQTVLRAFLSRFQTVVNTTGSDEKQPILGADPRYGELVRTYLTQKKRRSRSQGLYSMPLHRLLELLDTDQDDELKDLVPLSQRITRAGRTTYSQFEETRPSPQKIVGGG